MKSSSIILIIAVVLLYIPAIEMVRILVFDVELYPFNFTFFDFIFLSVIINMLQLAMTGTNRLLILKKKLPSKGIKLLIYSNIVLGLVLTSLYLTNHIGYAYFLFLPFSAILQAILTYYFIFDISSWLPNQNLQSS
jgi:hypothetical protein